MDEILASIDTSQWTDEELLAACRDRGLEVDDRTSRRKLAHALHADVDAAYAEHIAPPPVDVDTADDDAEPADTAVATGDEPVVVDA